MTSASVVLPAPVGPVRASHSPCCQAEVDAAENPALVMLAQGFLDTDIYELEFSPVEPAIWVRRWHRILLELRGNPLDRLDRHDGSDHALVANLDMAGARQYAHQQHHAERRVGLAASRATRQSGRQ